MSQKYVFHFANVLCRIMTGILKIPSDSDEFNGLDHESSQQLHDEKSDLEILDDGGSQHKVIHALSGGLSPICDEEKIRKMRKMNVLKLTCVLGGGDVRQRYGPH